VFARRFRADGAPRGLDFRVNTYTTGRQIPNRVASTVAADAAGNFVVVWESYGQDGSGSGVFGQRYDSTGTPQGAEFQVNTYTPGSQALPAVAADGTGNFVVAWTSGYPTNQDGSSFGIFGQRYDSTGAPVPGRVPVSGAKLTLTDHGATRRMVSVRSLDPSVANGINLAINPVANGAFLHIFNNAGSGDSACFPLPATEWRRVGTSDSSIYYKYRDLTFANGPCSQVTIKRGRVFRATCRSSVQPIPYSLDEAMQGSVGVNLTVGPATYCAVFGGTIVGDSATGGRFQAKNAPAPTSCPTPPASCP